MQFFVRTAALLVVAIAAFVIYGYAQHFAAVAVFPAVSPRPVSEMLCCAAAGAVAASVVASFPLAALFHRWAWLAAVVTAAPMLALRLPELLSYSGPLEQKVKVMALAESGSYAAALVLGAWLVSRVVAAL